MPEDAKQLCVNLLQASEPERKRCGIMGFYGLTAGFARADLLSGSNTANKANPCLLTTFIDAISLSEVRQLVCCIKTMRTTSLRCWGVKGQLWRNGQTSPLVSNRVSCGMLVVPLQRCWWFHCNGVGGSTVMVLVVPLLWCWWFRFP